MSLDALRESVVRAFAPMGFATACAGEDPDRVVRVFGGPDDRFWVLVCDEFDGEYLDFALHFAAERPGRAIGALCIDSDALVLSLADGGAFTDVCFGDLRAYDLSPSPFREGAWRALVGEDRWPAFRAAIAREYELADDALAPMAELIGFSLEDAMRRFHDPGKPLLECAFKRPGAVPLYLPDASPPALRLYSLSPLANPVSVSFDSVGGAGKGLRVLVAANGFDVDECPIDGMRLSWGRIPGPGDEAAAPEPVRFADGRRGWMAHFPDVAIQPGFNSAHPDFRQRRMIWRRDERRCSLEFAVLGGPFPEVPMFAGFDLIDEISSRAPTVDIWVSPYDNVDGAASVRAGLSQYRPRR
ncbi:MAG: hypothetical protein GX558_06885 [Clostridiales bacterium]|nr:hypothetical protein [Clostridiales bacterium]